jgi:hypothetical protein
MNPTWVGDSARICEVVSPATFALFNPVIWLLAREAIVAVFKLVTATVDKLANGRPATLAGEILESCAVLKALI